MANVSASDLAYIKPIMVWCNILSFIGVLLLTVHYLYKMRTEKAKKMSIVLRTMASTFMLSSSLALFCKIIMPYAVNCQWGQRITVFWYTLMRGSYYLFLCFRLELAFCDSLIDPIKKKPMQIFRWFVGITTIFIGVWNIAGLTTTFEVDVLPWGLYCEIHTPKANVLFFGAFDFIVSMTMVYMFSSKLYQVSKFLNSIQADQDSCSAGDRQLLQKLKILTTLAVISIISTWIFVVGGHTVLPYLNWTVTIDYFINVCCLYLMFGFIKLRERLSIAQSIDCPGSTYCCWCWCCPPFKYLCWNEETRECMEMNGKEPSKSQVSGQSSTVGVSPSIGSQSAKSSQNMDESERV
eukprot:52372_1